MSHEKEHPHLRVISQAEATPDSLEPAEPQEGRVSVQFELSQRALDQLTGIALIDNTTVADQARTGVHRYLQRRLNDPRLPELAKQRRRELEIGRTTDNK